MFHIFTGDITSIQNKIYIQNTLCGIQIHYAGKQKKGTVYVYPHLDDNHKTIKYFAFDTAEQKDVFENLLKINGIGPKTAFQIAQIDNKLLQQAINDLDVKFFQQIPWIGPKWAKKILLELKDTLKTQDLQKLDIDEKLYKKITISLKTLGYETNKVKEALKKYDQPLSEKELPQIIKRLMKNI